jgi:hypothetical protein
MRKIHSFILVVLLCLSVPVCAFGDAYTKWAVVTDAEFGATGDGSTDDTAAIQSAIDTGNPVYFPPGTYIVTDQLDISTEGQLLSGQGSASCRILVQTSGASEFNGSADGVLVFSTAAKYAQVRDLWVEFNQPSSVTRSDYVQPPAIYAQDVIGLVIRNTHIQEAWQGIDLRGDTTGAIIKNLQISSFDAGIMVDGLVGEVNFESVHFWAFYNLTENQESVFQDFNLTDNSDPNLSVAFEVGAVGASGMVNIKNCMCLSAYGLVMLDDTYPRVTIKNGWFERGCQILQLAGELYIEGCLMSVYDNYPAVGGGYALRQIGGTAMVRNLRMLANSDSAEAIVVYGDMSIANSILFRNGGSNYRIHVYSGGELLVNGVVFDNSATYHYGNPWVYVANGGLIQHVGCRYHEGETLEIATDSAHIVVGNSFGTGTDAPTLPGTQNNMVYENNYDS